MQRLHFTGAHDVFALWQCEKNRLENLLTYIGCDDVLNVEEVLDISARILACEATFDADDLT